MKKDLLIQKLVKIAKDQQLLLRKLAIANFEEREMEYELPPDFDEALQRATNIMQDNFKIQKITQKLLHQKGEINFDSNILPSLNEYKKLADGDKRYFNEYGENYPDWNKDHFQLLLRAIEQAFDNIQEQYLDKNL